MWPAHSFEVRPWVSANRAGNREDRLFTQVTTAIPPLIAAETFAADSAVLLACENATIAITRLDVGRGEALAPLGDFLLRSEANPWPHPRSSTSTPAGDSSGSPSPASKQVARRSHSSRPCRHSRR